MSEHCAICGDSDVITALRFYELVDSIVLSCEDCAAIFDLKRSTNPADKEHHRHAQP